MAKQRRVGHDPLAWIRSTVESGSAEKEEQSTKQSAETITEKGARLPSRTSVTEGNPEREPLQPLPLSTESTKLRLSSERQNSSPTEAKASPSPSAKVKLERKNSLTSASDSSLKSSTQNAEQNCLIALSAKTEEALQEKFQELADWLEEEGAAHRLEYMSYTLLIGRTHFPVRAAFVVHSVGSLQSALQQVLDGHPPSQYLPPVPRSKRDTTLVERGNRLLADWGQEQKSTLASWLELGELYVGGCNLEWQRLFTESDARRISMPTYPFAQERYWLSQVESIKQSQSVVHLSKEAVLPRLHPLIDRNLSTIHGLRFTTRLTGTEPFLSEGTVPRSVLLEMARAGGELAAESSICRMHSVVFGKPALLSFPLELSLHLWTNGDELDFEINSAEDVHVQGSLTYEISEKTSRSSRHDLRIDLQAVKRRCVASSGKQGDIQEYGLGQGEAYARLQISDSGEQEAKQLMLHPSILDGAFWVAAKLADSFGGAERTNYLPYAFEELVIEETMGDCCHVYVKKAGPVQYDLFFLDEEGHVKAQILHYAHKLLGKQTLNTDEEQVELLRRLQRGEIDVHDVKRLAGGV